MACSDIQINFVIGGCTDGGKRKVDFTLTNTTTSKTEYSVDYENTGSNDLNLVAISAGESHDSLTHDYNGGSHTVVFTYNDPIGGGPCSREINMVIEDCCTFAVFSFIDADCNNDSTREASFTIVSSDASNSEVKIDWGDGNVETQAILSGQAISMDHDYIASSAGDYIATVSFPNGECDDKEFILSIAECLLPDIPTPQCEINISKREFGDCQNGNRTFNIEATISRGSNEPVNATLNIGGLAIDSASGIGSIGLTGEYVSSGNSVVAMEIQSNCSRLQEDIIFPTCATTIPMLPVDPATEQTPVIELPRQPSMLCKTLATALAILYALSIVIGYSAITLFIISAAAPNAPTPIIAVVLSAIALGLFILALVLDSFMITMCGFCIVLLARIWGFILAIIAMMIIMALSSSLVWIAFIIFVILNLLAAFILIVQYRSRCLN